MDNQDKSKFEEQRKDLDQDKEKDGAIRYEMKNVEGEPRTTIRDAIAEQSNDTVQNKPITNDEIKEAFEIVEKIKVEDSLNKSPTTDQEKDKEFLDKEKAAYLFDSEEISVLEKDLNEMNKNPYAYDEESELNKDYLKFLEDNQDQLEKVFEDGYDNEKLITSSITFENVKDSSVRRLKIIENTDNAIKDKIAKQIKGITDELANQKGLSKIWTIREKFGIDEDKDITEEKAFNKESQKVDDRFYKGFRIFKENYKYTIPVTCQTCKGNKLIKILFFKIKCPVCKGTGRIQVDPEEYIKKSRDTQKTEVQEKRTRTLIFDDQKSVNF